MADDQSPENTDLHKCSISRRGNVFQNPFPEFKWLTFKEILRLALWERDHTNLPASAAELDSKLPYCRDAQHNFDKLNRDNSNLVSWIGHASCLVKISGVFVLTDPIFSQNCSAIQWNLGRLTRKLRRFRQPGLQLENIPKVDAVVISHNHYDHLDYPTVLAINKKFGDARWIVPLGLKSWFVASGIGADRISELTWWEEEEQEFGAEKITFTCLPAQHWTVRNGFDWNHTLWCGWGMRSAEKNVYFSGDTGYNDRIFRQIGEHCGPFDLSLIPIGAYEPRDLLKRQHVNPDEAVSVHRDVQSKFSLGIHWGTFMLGYENYLAPRRDLETALKLADINPEEFVTWDHGQTGIF